MDPINNIIKRFNETLNEKASKYDSYYAYKDAMKNWLKDNPGKSKRDWQRIGAHKQDKYIDIEMANRGYKKGEYRGKGVYNFDKVSLEALAEHVKKQVPLCDSIFRYQSEAYFDTFKTARKLREAGALPELDWESEEMLGTDIGESVELKGVGKVWLDVPYLSEDADYVYEGDELDELIAELDADLSENDVDESYDSMDHQQVAGILGKALGKEENEWSELQPEELFSELESENPELADMISNLAKLVYDVKLEENVSLSSGKIGGPGEKREINVLYINGKPATKHEDYMDAVDMSKEIQKMNPSRKVEIKKEVVNENQDEAMKLLKVLHKQYVASGKRNAFELGGLLRPHMPELSKSEVAKYTGECFRNFGKDDLVENNALDYLDKSIYKNQPLSLELQRVLAAILGIDDYYSMNINQLEARLEAEAPSLVDMYQNHKKELQKQMNDKPAPYDLNMSPYESIDEAEYNGKKVELNKPKRGGSKKYYVYVKNPKTDRVKKISFGDVTGLKTKSGNKKRAKSFAARHNCEKKNDKMKAGYWACRLPRYGLVKGGKWW